MSLTWLSAVDSCLPGFTSTKLSHEMFGAVVSFGSYLIEASASVLETGIQWLY